MLGLARKRRTVPYGMFDFGKHGLEAQNAKVLERIYHKGQAQAWDGRAVLSSLISQHGVPDVDPEKKHALGRVFAVIMWGELAAWRISAELADEIEPLEAKMAATSQAFDEARHFYVMHDYLVALGALPDRLDRGAQALLDGVMNADSLPKKLLGMQLMVEPVALTLFHIVKRLEIEPVLTHLLPYYERDEARHVALGVQYLPALLSKMSVPEALFTVTVPPRPKRLPAPARPPIVRLMLSAAKKLVRSTVAPEAIETALLVEIPPLPQRFNWPLVTGVAPE